MLGAADAIAIVGLVMSVVSAVATSACCAYCCSRNEKYTIERLKKCQSDLEKEVNDLKKMDDEGAVFTGAEQRSSLIKDAKKSLDGLSETIKHIERELDERCMCTLLRNVCVQNKARSSLEEKIHKLDDLIEKAEKMSKEPVKGYKLLEENSLLMGEKRIKIWDAVSARERAGTICIHGTLGVGKTTIATYIHNQALKSEHDELFKRVIWVGLDNEAGLWQVQGKIAERLDFDLSKNQSSNGDSEAERHHNDTKQRAVRLNKELLKWDKFLLVLDSMWKPLSLEEIGIPELVNGRKLIVTSRISNICKNIVSKRTFEIKLVDPWKLFEYKMGQLPEGLEDADVCKTKRAIAEYDGIPLAISQLVRTLGAYPDNLDRYSAWMNELAKPTIYLQSKDPEILDRFKTSYENLREETRRCFMYCALFPKNHLIETKELIEYWIWEGLFNDNMGTLEEEREVGKGILQELKEAHLLESVDAKAGERVKMLNLFRSLAIETLVKEGKHVCNRSGGSLTSLPPSGRDWNFKVERASFMSNKLTVFGLNGSMQCGQLVTLLLQDNSLVSKVEKKFFRSMPNLRVLDLSRTSISSLPKCLSELINLCALLVRDCPNLEKLPTLSKLEQLIVLDLSGTPLKDPPQGISKMKGLRRLNLSQTKLATFPKTVVRQLLELEELLMITDGNCIWGSSVDGKHEGVPSLPCIEDLVKLKKLGVLQLHFRDTKAFDKYVDMTKDSKFGFRVGKVQSVGNVEGNSLTISGISIDIGIPGEDRTLEPELNVISLWKLTNLSLLDVSNFSSLSDLFSSKILGSLTELMELRVRCCKEMVEAVRQPEEHTISLPKLTRIVFIDLPRLESVCSGKVLRCPKLSSIGVWRCYNFKLPMIDSGGKEIQIEGEKCWLANLEWENCHGHSNPTYSVRVEELEPLNLRPPSATTRISAIAASTS